MSESQNRAEQPASQGTPGDGSVLPAEQSPAKKSPKGVWIVIGIVAALYAMSKTGGIRGDEAAADAKFDQWATGQVENTWGGR